MEAQLRRLGSNSKIKRLKISRGCGTKIWLAGRGAGCQIYTNSKYASRKHFSITFKEQKYFISDLQSINGTFVDDEKLICEKVLQFGNIISVGVPSQMQNDPESVVFIFELHSDGNSKGGAVSFSRDDEIIIINEVLAENRKHSKRTCDRNEASCEVKISEVVELNKTFNETEKTVLHVFHTSPNKVSANNDEGDVPIFNSVNEARPAKIRKLNEEILVDCEGKDDLGKENKFERCEMDEQSDLIYRENEEKVKGINVDNEDEIMAYEALTQVDEPQLKIEPDLLNYSVTEELIEISDSEEEREWTSPSINLKNSESKLFEEEEDDDVVFLKRIVKRKRETKNDHLFPVKCEVGDDFTEVDKKWMEKLLKLKQEKDIVSKVELEKEIISLEEVEIDNLTNKNDVNAEGFPASSDRSRVTSFIRSTDDFQQKSAPINEVTSAISAPESSKKTIKKVIPPKSVRFCLVPEIRYFEVPTRPRLSPAEKGRLRFMKTIYNICNWNSQWLEECKRVAPEKDPPGICDQPLRKIPKKFASHLDYMGAFIPVMLLQLWNRVKENWVTSGDASFRMTVSCDSYEDYLAENLSICKCSGIVQSVKGHQGLLREGHLVLLRLYQVPDAQYKTPACPKYSKKLGYLVFGFVESKVYERFHGQPVHSALAERCSSISGDLHIVRLAILMKKRPKFKIDKQKLIQLTVVQHISPEIRMFRGICFLVKSPLCRFILKPIKSQFALTEAPENKDLVFKGPLDTSQSEIVAKLSHTCSSTSHFLFSIHGAAGTGKGQVILAFILQLLYGDEWRKCGRPKILYCTQSSTPLDDMVWKLKNCLRSLEGKTQFTMIRVGQMTDVKPEIKDVCLSSVALRRRFSDTTSKEGGMRQTEIQILEESDVICTTCSSTGMTKMTSVFEKLLARRTGQKIICVIDEAMSCREADSVIPLLLGVTHLVLVGDIYLLESPFSGQKTNFLGSDKSLFWRIYKNFTNIPRDLWPIYILKAQYRMNADLSKLVGRLVYSTTLFVPADCGPAKISNMRSHLLLVHQTPDDLQGSEKKTREGRLVIQLVRTITKLMRRAGKGEILRFAVVSCDLGQCESLRSFLPKSKFPEVEVNGVQEFQGREVDVALFHYDGSKIFTSQIAVALTRAKSNMFVLASQQSIIGNTWFKKLSEDAEKHNFLKYVQPNTSLEALERIISD